MTQSLNQLLLGYLPLIVFIAVAAVLGLALLLSSFVFAYKQPDPESSPPTNAASMRSTTRA